MFAADCGRITSYTEVGNQTDLSFRFADNSEVDRVLVKPSRVSWHLDWSFFRNLTTRPQAQVWGSALFTGTAMPVRPVTYNWRTEEFPQRRFPSDRAIGLIAQEVEKVFPDMVSTDEAGYKNVNYGELPYLMLQAIPRTQKGRNKPTN